ncbi:hypothetical protein H2201_004062 [Coniosporium apollinis]|uniref:Uncharacterized protein n=2 Tax=Coniosporium TaxID=2810619 RepID=A0ABQ9NTK8_9PEZI|nr:hypothetical protein H2199_006358 [Cladosporium sp. JES 115]KAJ9665754.1 hypothetical protein H2201_004062 [Coniosporium apollinis]
MKFTLSAFSVALLASTTSAWSLKFYDTSGRVATSSGTLDSGCKTLSWSPALNVNKVTFDQGIQGTFELYVNTGCSGLSYRNGGGTWTLTPARVIRSYKVY